MANKTYVIIGKPDSGKTTLLRKLAPDAVTIDISSKVALDSVVRQAEGIQSVTGQKYTICIDDADKCVLDGTIKTILDSVLKVADVYIIIQPSTLASVQLRWERYAEIYCMSEKIIGMIPEEYCYKTNVCTHSGYLKKTYEVTSPFEGGVSVDIDEFISGRKARVTVEVEYTARMSTQVKEPERIHQKQGSLTDVTTCANAAKDGCLDRLRTAHENGYGWDSMTCARAASVGSIECLKYAHENGCPWDVYTCNNSITVECLKYAHENGCIWKAQTSAALVNTLELLKYAHENGCPWNAKTCSEAAKCGNLDCLRYLHENGCEWDKLACECAVRYGNLDCLQYLHENGCEWGSEVAHIATYTGNDDCLQYLCENGCEWE
jgi:hypothetical protein